MTEYDYSPEAYQRYLATQARIAKWVDNTERHRPEFEHAVPTSSNPSPSGWRKLFKRSPSPSTRRRPADIYVPPPESSSSDSYDDRHHRRSGPSPPPSPGMMIHQQQPIYHMAQPMMSPPPVIMPQGYMPAQQHYSHSHHRSKSHSRSRSHHSPAYYTVASPPLSPGYQYTYQQPQYAVGGAPGSYMMMPPQTNGAQIMPNTQPLPHSAPPSVNAVGLPTPSGNVVATDYFHRPPHQQPLLTAQQYQQPTSPYSSVGGSWATYGVGSPAQSITSMPAQGSVAIITSPPSTPFYYAGAPMAATGTPQLVQHVPAVAMPMHTTHQLTPPTSYQPFVVPQGVHPRVYDLSQGAHRGGSSGRHNGRHSIS